MTTIGAPSPPRRTVVRRATAAPTFDTVSAVAPRPEELSFDDETTGDPAPEGDGDCIGCAPAIGGPEGEPRVGDPAGTGPAAAPAAPHRVGGRIEAPRKTHHVDPVYPELARAAHVSGTVILECVIGRDGGVRSVTVLRGHPLLEAAAADAVRQWTYRPTLLNGVPVDVLMTVTVRFSL